MEKVSLKEKAFSKKTVLSFVVSFAALYFVLTNVDVGKTFEIIKKIEFTYYLTGFVVAYTSFLMRALRWGVLLGNAGLFTPKRDTGEIYVLSTFANCIIPAKLGDIYRAYLLKRHYNHSISKAMGTIFVERALDVITIVGLLVFGGSLAFKGKVPVDLELALRIGALVSVLLIAMIALISHWQGSISKFAPSLAKDIIVRFEEGVAQSLGRRTFPKIAVYTLIIWVADGVRLYFVSKSVGLEISIFLLFFVSLGAALLTAFPATPAGLGAVEFAMVGSLMVAGVVKEVAVSITFLDRAITYWSFIIIGGIIYAISDKT